MAAISLDAAAAAMRDTMRDTVRRNSLLYLLQGILMVITGVLALIYPSLASVAIVRLLGWFLIASGIFLSASKSIRRHADDETVRARFHISGWSCSQPYWQSSLAYCCCATPTPACCSSACSSLSIS
jgi:Short repeat of unknown function (DUF308)